MSGILVEPYTPAEAAAWNDFVARSKNATFLHHRGYMDYHADRFPDASLMVRREGELVALLPAHRTAGGIGSHDGLTYGGFLVSTRMTTPLMLEVFAETRRRLAAEGVGSLTYKTVPHIYHRLPAEEDRYALFRHDAVLVRRDLLSTIDMARRPPPQERRRRGAAKAAKHGVQVQEDPRWEEFWALLEHHLVSRFNRRPVHSLEEIRLLQGRFPQSIRLFTGRDAAGALQGGVVIYETHEVAHLQYAAATAAGFASGCLDRLFLHLLDEVFAGKRWFDFGNSTEQEGRWLNAGLIDQKEGFGGRAVAHDYYRLVP
ncbi:hypothetical protein ACI6QG_13510 [Roseococcus sp. DSY-14]|uniref:hypothetical protein n=1 Tax=Roseococcus sp. DSY-14 TaxID=3369650 RepID=UPI00387A87C7